MQKTFNELVDLGVYVNNSSGDIIVWDIDPDKAFIFAKDIYMAEIADAELAMLAAVEAGYIEMDFSVDEDGEIKVGYIATRDGILHP